MEILANFKVFLIVLLQSGNEHKLIALGNEARNSYIPNSVTAICHFLEVGIFWIDFKMKSIVFSGHTSCIFIDNRFVHL